MLGSWGDPEHGKIQVPCKTASDYTTTYQFLHCFFFAQCNPDGWLEFFTRKGTTVTFTILLQNSTER